MLAPECRFNSRLVPDCLVDLFRDAHAARLGQRLNPAGNIHTVTKYIFLLKHNIPQMYPDADLQLLVSSEDIL